VLWRVQDRDLVIAVDLTGAKEVENAADSEHAEMLELRSA
jgi:hypothetical protein